MATGGMPTEMIRVPERTFQYCRTLSIGAFVSLISAENLRKTYSSVTALDGVSLSVEEGEAVALLGQNGAGKSTLSNIVAGLIAPDAPPDSGRCTVFDRDSVSLDPATREKIGLISDEAGPVAWVSANEIARLYRALYERWDGERFTELLKLWELPTGRPLRTLSKGQRRLTEIALVASCRPHLMILDEPFNGLDPVMRVRIQRLLASMNRDEGTTILYATHVLGEVSTIARRVVILRKGSKVCDSALGDLDGGVEGAFMRCYGLSDETEAVGADAEAGA